MPGYTKYVQFMKTCNSRMTPEQVWKGFWETHHAQDFTGPFIDLFEFVQVKTFSEAICETIGSIMNIHRGRGRNLHPVNFTKEMYLRFNLAPMHVLKQAFIPELVHAKVVEEKKQYFRKTEVTKQASRQSVLKFASVSGTISNFRVKEERRSHLPTGFYQ